METLNLETRKIKFSPDNRSVGGITPITSVKTEGIIQPIIVRKINQNSYEVIAGNRRLKSAQEYGLETVPCIIRGSKDADIIRGLENLDREPLSPLDESDQINKMLKDGMTREQICTLLNISMWQLRRRERLKNLCPEAREAFVNGSLTLENAMHLVVVDESVQKAFFKAVKKRDAYINNVQGFLRINSLVNLEKKSSDIKAFIFNGKSCDTCNFRTEDDGLFEEGGTCTHADCFFQRMKAWATETKTPVVARYLQDYEKKRLEGLPILQQYGDKTPSKGSLKAINEDGETVYYRLAQQKSEKEIESEKEERAAILAQRKIYKEDLKVYLEQLITVSAKLSAALQQLYYENEHILGEFGVPFIHSALPYDSVTADIAMIYFPDQDKNTFSSRLGSYSDEPFPVSMQFAAAYIHLNRIYDITGKLGQGSPQLPDCRAWYKHVQKWIPQVDTRPFLTTYHSMCLHQYELGNRSWLHDELGDMFSILDTEDIPLQEED